MQGAYCLARTPAVAFLLCKMAFCLSNKVATLHLDTSITKAYLCNQGGTASLFLSGLACHILNLAKKHGISLMQVYIPTYLNVEADYLLGSVHSLMAPASSHSSDCISPLGSAGGGYYCCGEKGQQAQHPFLSVCLYGFTELEAFGLPVVCHFVAKEFT